MVFTPSSRSTRAPPPSATPTTARQAYHEKFGRPNRFVPTDKFFIAYNEARERDASAQELRCIAMQQVQPARVPETDKIVLWIPAPQIARVYGTPEVMDAINREEQSQTWASVSSSVCAIEVVKNRGIRITCTNRDLAIKLGGTTISCMGQKLIVKPYSAYDRFYYVDLTHLPSGLSDDEIYDYFAGLGLQPIITPTHVAGPLMSSDRTVWFPQHDVPDALLTDGVPLREIKFPEFDFPVYVQHKKRSLNKTLPPSIIAKRTAVAAAAAQPRVTQRAAGDRRENRREGSGDPNGVPATRAQTIPPLSTAPSSTSPVSSAPDGAIILERPEASAPIQDWIKVSRHALCSSSSSPVADWIVDVSTAPSRTERIVFGFPIKPTDFELAFSDHDSEEPTAGDADCVVYSESQTISGSPLALADSVSELVVARSFLRPKTNSLKRSEYRRRARKAAQELPQLQEPDDRLAALTAQPSAYAALVYANPPELLPVVEDHALLRLYSGKPSSTHGTNCSLLSRLATDYKIEEAPATSAILADQILDDSYRELALAYARVDLFFRTHAPAIYHDPVKVQALCNNNTVSSFQYSNFLLWTDETLAALCQSRLGQEFEQYLSLSVMQAFQLILDDHISDMVDSTSTTSSMSDVDDATVVTHTNDSSTGSTEPTQSSL